MFLRQGFMQPRLGSLRLGIELRWPGPPDALALSSELSTFHSCTSTKCYGCVWKRIYFSFAFLESIILGRRSWQLSTETWEYRGFPVSVATLRPEKDLLMPSTTPHFLHLLLEKRLPVISYLILWWFCPFLREELMSFVHNKDGEAVAWFWLISHTGRNRYRFEYSQWRYYIDNFSICVL